jgi:signal transduction histidine kinase
MNIKSKLSFQFTILVMGILIFFSVLTYYFAFTSQREKFRQNLYRRAKNTIILLVDVKEVDSSLLKKIHQSTFSWMNEEIAVADSAYHLIYSHNLHYITPDVTRQHSAKGNPGFFSLAEKDGVYYRYSLKNKIYHVFVMAYDKYRFDNMRELREILFWSILFSLWLTVFLSYLFSKRALQPISQIIKSVKEINSLWLNRRLNEGNKRDELGQLAMTFNEMLANLEVAFRNQEEFVSNASHELRTPLTIMIVESDYFLNRKHSEVEYKDYINHLILDLKRLNEQMNSMLELAQIINEKSLVLIPVRIDEIIFNAIQQVKLKYPGRKILPKIDYPENENELLVEGNYGLLLIAFKNLIDNACKFSNEDVIVEVRLMDKSLSIKITDKGIGIPSKELDNIYKPFSRASNARYKAGFGIGLALVARIFELHRLAMTVNSLENIGTRFQVTILRPTKEEIKSSTSS